MQCSTFIKCCKYFVFSFAFGTVWIRLFRELLFCSFLYECRFFNSAIIYDMILGQEKSKTDSRNCNIKLYLKGNIFVSIDEYKGKWQKPGCWTYWNPWSENCKCLIWARMKKKNRFDDIGSHINVRLFIRWHHLCPNHYYSPFAKSH